MKKLLLCTTLLISVYTISYGQESIAVAADTVAVKDTTYWHRGTTLALNLSQSSLTNWNAGGQNAIAYNALSTSYLNYEKGKLAYSNSLTMAFGQANLGQKGWRKTDDRFYYVSKLSYEKSKKFRYTVYLDFLSQFANGNNYIQSNSNPKLDSAVLVSKFLSRAYSSFALGVEYAPVEGLFIFFSPATIKTTIVAYQPFANKGDFGVRPEYIDANGKHVAGRNFLFEPSAMLNVTYKKDIKKNISVQTNLSLFWAYIRKKYDIDPTTGRLLGSDYVFYKNVDVMWNFSLVMKVTKYINASITTSLIYDDDINVFRSKYADDPTNPHAYGPAIQFKQVLGIGLQAILKSKY
jgi:hypothetical protein